MKTVLIVDDNGIDTFLNRKILERTRKISKIQTATNGKDAIAMLHDCHEKVKSLPDIILLDLNMPVMNGFAFIESFKNMDLPGKENISIVVLTSSNSIADLQLAKEVGIDRYITKPLTEDKVLSSFDIN